MTAVVVIRLGGACRGWMDLTMEVRKIEATPTELLAPPELRLVGDAAPLSDPVDLAAARHRIMERIAIRAVEIYRGDLESDDEA